MKQGTLTRGTTSVMNMCMRIISGCVGYINFGAVSYIVFLIMSSDVPISTPQGVLSMLVMGRCNLGLLGVRDLGTFLGLT